MSLLPKQYVTVSFGLDLIFLFHIHQSSPSVRGFIISVFRGLSAGVSVEHKLPAIKYPMIKIVMYDSMEQTFCICVMR